MSADGRRPLGPARTLLLPPPRTCDSPPTCRFDLPSMAQLFERRRVAASCSCVAEWPTMGYQLPLTSCHPLAAPAPPYHLPMPDTPSALKLLPIDPNASNRSSRVECGDANYVPRQFPRVILRQCGVGLLRSQGPAPPLKPHLALNKSRSCTSCQWGCGDACGGKAPITNPFQDRLYCFLDRTIWHEAVQIGRHSKRSE
jgi:hypothetical protein